CLLGIGQETAKRHYDWMEVSAGFSAVEAYHGDSFTRPYANPLRCRAAMRRSSRLMRFGLGAGGVEGVSLVFAGFGVCSEYRAKLIEGTVRALTLTAIRRAR